LERDHESNLTLTASAILDFFGQFRPAVSPCTGSQLIDSCERMIGASIHARGSRDQPWGRRDTETLAKQVGPCRFQALRIFE